MAFAHGRDALVLANGINLQSYFQEATPELASDVNEVTTFGKSHKCRLPGLKDTMLSLAGFWDGATGAVDPTIYGLVGATTPGLWVVYTAGDTVGNIGYALRANLKNYPIETDVEGVVAISAELEGTDTSDRVVSLHALGAETNTGTGTVYDAGAASTNGAAAHLHVTAITGTSVAVTIEDSADGSSGWATIITFTTVSAAPASERATCAGTVRRYRRAKWTGTFTGTFAVGFSEK